MKVAALVSGGKDSIYSMMQCVAHGHTISVLVNLQPPTRSALLSSQSQSQSQPPSASAVQSEHPQTTPAVITPVNPADDEVIDELDSFMYQTVGHEAIAAVAECLEIPLLMHDILGGSNNTQLEYTPTCGDEVECMYNALARAKAQFPEIQAVCSGAILSTYQKNRVTNVCERLGLTPLSYLWSREQVPLLTEILDSGVDPIIIKVAALGLTPPMLGMHLRDAFPRLLDLNTKYGIHVCGEGGEYESLVLDCPLYKKKIVIDGFQKHVGPDGVGYIHITQYHLEKKT
ncbi:protein E01A2.5 [Pelomyxa schiedti]|nr:protein E01A2.5 [Pelomyxa schiedti]